jgi:hypothetical protein
LQCWVADGVAGGGWWEGGIVIRCGVLKWWQGGKGGANETRNGSGAGRESTHVVDWQV